MRVNGLTKGFFILIVLIVTLAFFDVLSPYYSAILWAAILAVIFHPVKNKLRDRLGERNGLAALLKAGCVKKVVCSFPRQVDSWVFDDLYRRGEVALELVPQGNLAARIQAAGSGLGGIFTPTGFGTQLAEGKETRRIDGKDYVFETPLRADFALIKALKADRWGNLVFDKTGRNFGPIMATAAKTTIVEVSQLVALGDLDPEHIITPGIFVQRVFSLENLTAAQRA